MCFPFSYRALRKGVEKFEEGVGISNLGNHSFRHNLATNLVGKNITMQVISDILGHSSITTTAKFYPPVRVDYKVDALAKSFIYLNRMCSMSLISVSFLQLAGCGYEEKE